MVPAIEQSFIQNQLPTSAATSTRFEKDFNSFNCQFILITTIEL
jgi:hypothetical protein